MLSNIFAPSPRRIRVLNGPLQGTMHPISDRFRIGRSGMADLQLLDERVSREHAEIVAGPDGNYWLVDLGSSNGTFILDESIHRVLLSLDTIFHIEKTAFVFEEEIPALDDNEETLVVSYHGAPSRCGTVEYDAAAVLSEAAAEAEPPSPRSTPTRQRVTARYFNGLLYGGNVVEDIALFHTLLLRKSRNELRSTHDLDRFEKLVARLCLPVKLSGNQAPVARLYARLSCCIPATLRLPSGDSITVATADLGVDGAQVVAMGHGLKAGQTAWLTIDLVTGKRMRTLVFTSQVTWSSGSHIGLSFCGHRDWRAIDDTWQSFGNGLERAG